LSLLVHRSLDKPVQGLDQLEAAYGTPPVWLSFQSYHLMVGLGMLFIGSTLVASWLRWRGTLFQTRWLLWYFVFAVGLAFVANEVGWVAAEVGRQPWVVYPTPNAAGELIGGLRTADGVSEVVTSGQVLSSMVMFGVIYVLLFALWVFLLDRAIRRGPETAGVPVVSGADHATSSAITARAAHDRSAGAIGKERA
jgi:cytochrome d ubiquinol oxidase subunit I